MIRSAAREGVRIVRRLSFATCGEHARFDPWGRYEPAGAMHFGSHIFIGPGAVVSAHEGFFVGDGVIIGPELCVMGGDHNFSVVGRPMSEVTTGGDNRPIVIEPDVWVGARVTLLKGARLGEGAVIGAGSVVTRPVPPYVVAAGSPCRVLRPRFSECDLRRHLTVTRGRPVEDVLAEWQQAGLT